MASDMEASLLFFAAERRVLAPGKSQRVPHVKVKGIAVKVKVKEIPDRASSSSLAAIASAFT